MKKILFILVLFLLVGCSKSEDNELPVTKGKESERIEHFPVDIYYIIDQYDVLDIDQQHTYRTDKGYRVDTVYSDGYFKNATMGGKLLTYTLDNEDKPFAIMYMNRNNANSTVQKEAETFFSSIGELLETNELITNSNIFFSDEIIYDEEYNRTYDIMMFTLKPELNNDLIILNADLNKEDFLFQEDFDKFYDLIQNYKFEDAFTYSEEYINKNKPKESNSIYKINNILSNGREKTKLLVEEYDNVENKRYFYFKEKKHIDVNTNLITYLEDNNMKNIVGFTNDNWIFFEDVIVSMDEQEGEAVFGQINPKIEVLDGGMIQEYAECRLYEKYSTQIMNSNKSIIRFKGKDKNIDKEISEEEMEELKYIYDCQKVYYDLKSVFNTKEY